MPIHYETTIIGADKKNNIIGSLGIESVKLYDTFQAGSESVKNAVVFDTASSADHLKDFMLNKANINLYDENGVIYDGSISSGVYNDVNAEKLYMIFYSDADISNFKYAIIGGFAPKKNNNNSRFAVEISKS